MVPANFHNMRGKASANIIKTVGHFFDMQARAYFARGLMKVGDNCYGRRPFTGKCLGTEKLESMRIRHFAHRVDLVTGPD